MRHLVLAHQLQLLCAIFCDDSHKVRVRSESGSGCAQAVRHDHVHVLFRKLCPGIFQHILSFHGKAAKHLSLSPVGSKPCQNIIGAFQFNIHVAIALFRFLGSDNSRTVICHSRCLDNGILLCADRSYRVKHILRTDDRHKPHPQRRL